MFGSWLKTTILIAGIVAQFGGRGEDERTNPLVGLVVMILAPIAAILIQTAMSRAREFEADRGGAEICGNPNALADALVKMERYAKGLPMEEAAEAHPSTAQMMIVNLLSAGGMQNLFSTHAATEERIARLRAMA
jgi:heat shock protein HtpX